MGVDFPLVTSETRALLHQVASRGPVGACLAAGVRPLVDRPHDELAEIFAAAALPSRGAASRSVGVERIGGAALAR
jgi:hypothetical protein